MNSIKIPSKDSVVIIISLFLACFNQYITERPSVSFILMIPAIIAALYKTYESPSFSISVLLFLSFDAMGILPSVSMFGGTLAWADFSILYIVCMCLLFWKKKEYYRWNLVAMFILFFFGMMLVGSIRGQLIYQQNPLVGMLVLRPTYVLLGFLPIVTLMKSGTISKEDVIDRILQFVKIYTVLCLVQLLLLYMGIELTNFSYDYRWGIRMRASNGPQILGVFLSIYRFFNTRFNRKDWMWAITFLVSVVIINQSRVAIIGCLGAGVIMVLIGCHFAHKIFAIMLIAMCFLCVLIVPTTRNIIIDAVVENQSSNSGNMFIRDLEKLYFDGYLDNHKLLGVGTPNQNSGQAKYYSGQLISGNVKGTSHYLRGYFISDLGDYGMLYYWGYIGLTFYWLLLLWGIKDCLYLILVKKKFNIIIFLLGAMLIDCVLIHNTMCWLLFDPGMFLVIFLCWYIVRYQEITI